MTSLSWRLSSLKSFGNVRYEVYEDDWLFRSKVESLLLLWAPQYAAFELSSYEINLDHPVTAHCSPRACEGLEKAMLSALYQRNQFCSCLSSFSRSWVQSSS